MPTSWRSSRASRDRRLDASTRPPAGVDASGPLPELGPVRFVRTDVLEVGYIEAGPASDEVVVLLHGFPYDVHTFVDVVPRLVRAGRRVIVPYLRGHGPTRFLHSDTPRSGQQAAIGADVVALMDALRIPSAVLAGHDWGGRAACVVAALWPGRCRGLVSVNSYLIQDIASSTTPISPEIEAGLWYFYYFATERGRSGLARNRREIARVIWTRNSPQWGFSDALLDRAALAFDNPDYVDVVIHSYRHRLGLVPGFAEYDEIEDALACQPPIAVPAITLDGMADGNFPASDGTDSAHHFTGPRCHRQVPAAGHNLPQESPEAFADALIDVAEL